MRLSVVATSGPIGHNIVSTTIPPEQVHNIEEVVVRIVGPSNLIRVRTLGIKGFGPEMFFLHLVVQEV